MIVRATAFCLIAAASVGYGKEPMGPQPITELPPQYSLSMSSFENTSQDADLFSRLAKIPLDYTKNPALVCFLFDAAPDGTPANIEVLARSSREHVELLQNMLADSRINLEYIKPRHGKPIATCFSTENWQVHRHRSAGDMSREEKQWLMRTRNGVLEKGGEVSDFFFLKLAQSHTPQLQKYAQPDVVMEALLKRAHGDDTHALRALLLSIGRDTDQNTRDSIAALTDQRIAAGNISLCGLFLESFVREEFPPINQETLSLCIAAGQSAAKASFLMYQLAKAIDEDNILLDATRSLVGNKHYQDFRMELVRLLKTAAQDGASSQQANLQALEQRAQTLGIDLNALFAALGIDRHDVGQRFNAKTIRELFTKPIPTKTAD